jgi:hypothetical protein
MGPGPGVVPFAPEPDRTYDLVIVLWHPEQIAEHEAGRLELGADLVLYDRDRTKRKFVCLAEAIGRGEVRDDYEAVLVADDDLEPASSWSHVFALFYASGFKVAQPALTRDSSCMWAVNFRVGGLRWRQTNAVEVMAPILAGNVLREMLPRMLEDRNGWGLDAWWAAKYAPIGVLDGAPVRHLRPQGSAHPLTGLHEDPDRQTAKFCATHGISVVKERFTLGQEVDPNAITCLTAIFGGYERPKAPAPGVDRAIMLTDTTNDDRWELLVRREHGISPRRLIFTAKLTPHMFADTRDVLWTDGSIEPTGLDVRSLFALVPPGGVGIFRHTHGPASMAGRPSYWREAEFSHADPRYRAGGPAQDRGRLALEQAKHYRARGCSVAGLWSTGVLVWRGAQHRLGERWLAETMAWSASDQIALPYAIHATGVDVTTLPGNVYDNPWFTYVEHGQEGKTTPRPAPRAGRCQPPEHANAGECRNEVTARYHWLRGEERLVCAGHVRTVRAFADAYAIDPRVTPL